MEFLEFIKDYLNVISITDVVDVGIVSYVIYLILRKIKGTSAERLIKGVAVLIIINLIANIFNLNTINFILENLTQVGLIALVVVFQPELRKMLEKVGKTKIYRHGTHGEELSDGEIIINSVVDACLRLSDAREGALIVFEREDSLKDIIETGISMSAYISSPLIRNVFYPKAPLHDGAMVIANESIVAAACILPLSKNQNISKDLGTRHRAAAGMTEITDSICVVVSEETGSISVSSKGMLKRHLSKDLLTKLLKYELLPKEEKQSRDKLSHKIDRAISNFFLKSKSDVED